jgi:hypothetical protein
MCPSIQKLQKSNEMEQMKRKRIKGDFFPMHNETERSDTVIKNFKFWPNEIDWPYMTYLPYTTIEDYRFSSQVLYAISAPSSIFGTLGVDTVRVFVSFDESYDANGIDGKIRGRCYYCFKTRHAMVLFIMLFSYGTF